MTTKHTPGPWIAVTENDGEGPFEVRAPPYIVARVFSDPGAYTVANQHLIAAAPSLLAQLKLAVMRLARVDGGDSTVISNAVDAILAATGEAFDFEAAIADEDAKMRGR